MDLMNKYMLTGLIDRHTRRRPFSTWMKRLANLKNTHSDSNSSNAQTSPNTATTNGKTRKQGVHKNSPYPLSGRVEAQDGGDHSLSDPSSPLRSRHSSLAQSKRSISPSHESHQPLQKSRAPTLATTAETTHSDVAPSGVGTSATAARTEGDRNSTFSSPAPSLRSVTTTLTTIQSTAAPGSQTNNQPATTSSNQFSSAFYPHAQAASAIPSHLAPQHANNPTTYSGATANNVLTDDASILTLASSSKRRRRNSADTNASVKAIPPASMFGGSRESLPLSVLSGTIIHGGGGSSSGMQGDNASLRDASGTYTSSKLNPERASLISASGVTAPALASERNSYIGSKYGGGDAASVRSGLLGGGGAASSGMHGRNDSVSGSIGGYKEKDKERDNKDRDREREREMDEDREKDV